MYCIFTDKNELEAAISSDNAMGHGSELVVKIANTNRSVEISRDDLLKIVDETGVERLRCDFTTLGLRFWWEPEESK